MAVEWRLRRPQDSATDPDLFDVYHKDAFNRFAREAKVWLEDPDGDKEDTYPRFTNVELDVKRDIDSSFIQPRFGGYVAESTHKSNAEQTILRCLSFDSFLRQKPVTRGYSSRTISYILEDLISDNEITPVQWASGANVTIENDVTITREWKGIPLDDVLEELSNISAGEEWGATDANEFFFRPVGSNQSPRDFTEGQYFDAEFGEDAKKAVFRVTVHYGDVSADGSTDNRAAVQIDQSGEQQTAGNRLGTSDVVVELQKYFPEITSKAAAKRKGNDILDRHSPLTIGNVTTWEGFDVRPGDVAYVEVPTNGTAGEFRVAQIEHSWRADETEVKLAENSQGVLDTLVVAADEIERLDSRGLDATATPDQEVQLEVGSTLELDDSLTIDKREKTQTVFLFGTGGGELGDTAAGGGVLGDSSLSTSTTTIVDTT